MGCERALIPVLLTSALLRVGAHAAPASADAKAVSVAYEDLRGHGWAYVPKGAPSGLTAIFSQIRDEGVTDPLAPIRCAVPSKPTKGWIRLPHCDLPGSVARWGLVYAGPDSAVAAYECQSGFGLGWGRLHQLPGPLPIPMRLPDGGWTRPKQAESLPLPRSNYRNRQQCSLNEDSSIEYEADAAYGEANDLYLLQSATLTYGQAPGDGGEWGPGETLDLESLPVPESFFRVGGAEFFVASEAQVGEAKAVSALLVKWNEKGFEKFKVVPLPRSELERHREALKEDREAEGK